MPCSNFGTLLPGCRAVDAAPDFGRHELRRAAHAGHAGALLQGLQVQKLQTIAQILSTGLGVGFGEQEF